MSDKVVSVRMSVESYERLVKVAEQRDIGVSTLVKQYIEFGLSSPFVRGTSFDGGETWVPDFNLSGDSA